MHCLLFLFIKNWYENQPLWFYWFSWFSQLLSRFPISSLKLLACFVLSLIFQATNTAFNISAIGVC